MENKIMVSASTHPAKDIADLISYAKKLQDAKSDLLHCDIMDGVFVKDKTFSYEVVNKLKLNCLLPLDVHLMINNPENEIENYARAGANILTIHYESFVDNENVLNCIKIMKRFNVLKGISIKPKTQIKDIIPLLEHIDLVLIMSVEPGKSGQKFILDSLEKIKELVKYKTENTLKFLIEVDGGINESNIKEIKDSGADIVVSGNYLYKSENLKKALKELQI